MKKILSITLLMLTFCSITMKAGNEVHFIVRDGLANEALKQKIQNNVSELLTGINLTVARGEHALDLKGYTMTNNAKNGLTRLWNHDNFRCPDERVVEEVLHTRQGYQVRGIPLVKIDENAEENYQEAVINFDKKGTIISFFYTINPELYTKAMINETKNLGRENEISDINRRMQIIDYVEHYRTAYNQKDINFIDQVFSEDALIITGTVIKARKTEVMVNDKFIKYTKQTKREYIANLRRAFAANKYINVKFSDIVIVHHPAKKDVYGVTVKQNWNSERYSDEGYLFMVWDFSNEDHPQIHVRTWQPEYIDKTTGRKLPENEVFSLKDFNIE